MTHFLVCKTDEIPEGGRKVISCDGTEVGVFKVDGEFYAWFNTCAHMRGPVCQGRIYKRVLEPLGVNQTVRMMEFSEEHTHIVCPWHGYEFDLKTGLHPGSSKHRLRKVKLEIRDGEVYVVL